MNSNLRYSPWKGFKQYMKEHGFLFHFCAAFLWVWALSLVALIVYGILVALTPQRDYELYPERWIPVSYTLKNFSIAFEKIQYGQTTFLGMCWNSVWYAGGVTFARLSTTILLTYALAKYEFIGRKPLYAFLIFQLMMPTYAGNVSGYVLMAQLGLVDSPTFLLSQFAGHSTNFLIFYSYFRGVAPEYKEAASIDGANDFQIFFKIILPVVKGPILAIAISMFIGFWNNYSEPLIYLPSYPTVMTGLFRYKLIATYTLNVPAFFSGVLIAAIPSAIVYACFSGTMMKNFTVGGIKG